MKIEELISEALTVFLNTEIEDKHYLAKLLDILESEPLIGFKVIKGIAQIISSRLRNCRMALLKTL